MIQVRGKEKVKASTHPENNRNQSELDICCATLAFHQRGLRTAYRTCSCVP